MAVSHGTVVWARWVRVESYTISALVGLTVLAVYWPQHTNTWTLASTSAQLTLHQEARSRQRLAECVLLYHTIQGWFAQGESGEGLGGSERWAAFQMEFRDSSMAASDAVCLPTSCC